MAGDSSQIAPASNRAWILGGVSVVVLPALFYALFWNRYFGINLDGWFQFFGQQILNGRVPYRDFYLFTNPLHALESAGLTVLFGTQWWILRSVAIGQRMVLALVAFLWLKRAGYAPPDATAGAVIASIVFGCDVADPLFYYHHDSVFYCVLAAFFASIGITSASSRASTGWLLLAGLTGGLAFLTKQTTGVGITLVLLTVPAAIAWKTAGFRRAFFTSSCVGIGWIVFPALLFAWLARESALHDYIEQVFLKGPTSKGPILEVLIRPLLTTLKISDLLFVALIALLTFVGFERLAYGSRAAGSGKTTNLSVSGIDALVLLAMAVGLALGLLRPNGLPVALLPIMKRFSVPPGVFNYQIALSASIYLTFMACIALFIRFGLRLGSKREWTASDSSILLLAAVSLNNCYFLSLSWPAFEPMVFPGLALVVAHYLTTFQKGGTNVAALWGKRLGLAALCLIVASAVAFKINRPFAWEGMIEPPVLNDGADCQLPQLRGLNLSSGTVDRLEKITSLIQTHSTDRDEIFVFPHLPIFYLLAERQPATFSFVHFWDVCPDFIARADAARLLTPEHQPKVIVEGIYTDDEIHTLERNFRAGQLSGQRDLIDAIHSLTTSGRYELLGTFPGENCMTLQVWARKPG